MNEKHQPNFIERMLMGIMQTVDTQTFSEKDKIQQKFDKTKNYFE